MLVFIQIFINIAGIRNCYQVEKNAFWYQWVYYIGIPLKIFHLYWFAQKIMCKKINARNIMHEIVFANL